MERSKKKKEGQRRRRGDCSAARILQRSTGRERGCLPMAAAGDEPETVEVTLRAVGPSRPTTLRLPPQLTVAISAAASPTTAVSRPRKKIASAWSCGGKTPPRQDDAHVILRDGDTLIVAVAPKPPANSLRDDEEEEELKSNIPQTTTLWKRKIFIFLRDKLRLPDILLMALFSISTKIWITIAVWFLLAPVAQKHDLGPLYLLGTGFLIILLNLGRRQQGDISAYSIFNEDFRELPGTLNVERLDRDIRAGQF